MKHATRTTGLLFVFLLILSSCNPLQTTEESKKIVSADSSSLQQQATPPVANDDIIEGTLTSKEGKKLRYRFDNQNSTMVILFDHDSTILKQDTSASGIKYSNQRYIYNEWHGSSTLLKDGRTVFTTDR